MIHIFPINHIENFKKLNLAKTDIPIELESKKHLFFYNGKHAIHHLINLFQLKRNDEVCILTTSNQNYVSTCVSATIFNYCKISRVITENTKMIYVIHEFGFPYNDIQKMVDYAAKKNIPLVEDCAHGILSFINNKQIGTFGDYTIYSLPKHLPISNGGLLVCKDKISSKTNYYDAEVANKVCNEFFKYACYINGLAENRKKNYASLLNAINIKTSPFKINADITPYFYILKTKKFDVLNTALNNKYAEWGRTYVKDWFCIPTQPLANENEFKKIATIINQKLNE